MKVLCSVCHLEKEISSFSRSARYDSGYFPECIECRKALYPTRRQPKKYQDDEIIVPSLKKCSHCQEEKSCSDFYPSNRYKSGLMSQCKLCKKALHKPRPPKTYSIGEIHFVEQKKCKDCNETKSTIEFYVSNRSSDGFAPRCKVCHLKKNPVNKERKRQYFQENKDKFENNRLWRAYGITLHDYNTMLLNQNFSCAICSYSVKDSARKLDVDHCHKTGRVRGLLCNRCNKFLGMIDVNNSVIQNLIEYLKAEV